MRCDGKPNSSGKEAETEVRKLKVSGLASDALKRFNSVTGRHNV